MTTEFKLNDYVNTPSDAIGKVIKKQTVYKIVYTIQFNSGRTAEYDGVDLQPAPKPNPEQAWVSVPMIAITQIKKGRGHMQDSSVIYEFERRAIRHECYVALGGAGVKVTDEVRERVADIVEDVAHAMGLRVV